MRVNLLGGGVFYGPHGVMESYGPSSEIAVDDSDKTAVAFWQARVDSGAAELVEAPKTTKAASTKSEPPPPAAEPEPPPKAGPGSSRDAWADYAASLNVPFDTEDMTRDEIMGALDEYEADKS